jgi:hypothetical protein
MKIHCSMSSGRRLYRLRESTSTRSFCFVDDPRQRKPDLVELSESWGGNLVFYYKRVWIEQWITSRELSQALQVRLSILVDFNS